MLRKTALLTTATLTMAIAAGCSASPAPATPSADGTVSVLASMSTSAPASDPTSDPGDNETAGGDAGDGGNWFSALKPCPQGQATEVQRLEFGDVTGDGVKDALVARSCDPVTSRWPSTVEVFDGTTGEKPRRIGVLLEEAGATDRPWVVSLGAGGGVVTVKAHGVSEDAAMACPDLVLTYTYKFGGGEFTRTARTATASTVCLSID